jgi:hypothetical protein
MAFLAAAVVIAVQHGLFLAAPKKMRGSNVRLQADIVAIEALSLASANDKSLLASSKSGLFLLARSSTRCKQSPPVKCEIQDTDADTDDRKQCRRDIRIHCLVQVVQQEASLIRLDPSLGL